MLDYRVISALVHQLPQDGRWTAAARERWLTAMTAALDYMFELTEPEKQAELIQEA